MMLIQFQYPSPPRSPKPDNLGIFEQKMNDILIFILWRSLRQITYLPNTMQRLNNFLHFQCFQADLRVNQMPCISFYIDVLSVSHRVYECERTGGKKCQIFLWKEWVQRLHSNVCGWWVGEFNAEIETFCNFFFAIIFLKF